MTTNRTVLALFALTMAAHAGPRTSVNYTIATDSTDAGGKRSTSTSYTNDGSAGGITGVSIVASPAETAKAGYLGQLYDVTGLVVNAGGATTVNETGTIQLAAWRLLDDTSLLAVNATAVTWGVVSGPVSSISTGGLATAATVYQNTAASVQGAFGGFSGTLNLTVLNTNPDNFGSYAGDGIDDAWQVQYFGLNNLNAGPTKDPDGDGQNNLFEFNVGTVPNDPNSRLQFRIESVSGQPLQKRFIFSPRLTDRTYVVKASTILGTGASWVPLSSSTTSDNGSERTVIDLNATGGRRFYNLEVTKP